MSSLHSSSSTNMSNQDQLHTHVPQSNDPVLQYQTYEDYLDSQILPEDIEYLESEDLMRSLVELGYRGTGETLKRSAGANKRNISTDSLSSHVLISTPLRMRH